MKRLRELVAGLWRWVRKGHDERRVSAARARFWSEVREGEREAKAHVRP